MGLGRLTTESEVLGVSVGRTVFMEGFPAVLMMAFTIEGSLYSMLLRNRIVRCWDPGSSANLRPRALGFDGRPMVGRLWRGVFVGSGEGVGGEGGSVLEGRIFCLRRGCCEVSGRFCRD